MNVLITEGMVTFIFIKNDLCRLEENILCHCLCERKTASHEAENLIEFLG